jgi:hypothetical protein
VDSSQLGSKVAALETKVATLEDEGKIIKGEIKNVLTEIRTAILARDNPFDADHGARIAAMPAVTAAAPRMEEPAPAPPPRAPEPEPEPEPEPDDAWGDADAYAAEPAREPVKLVPPAPPAPAQQHHPDWSLLTIASLSAWAEEAMRRLGALRLEILLDLCEAAGHLTQDARSALSRITDLDVPAPAEAPSTNDTVVILRQLDALLNDEHEDYAPLRLQRR